ncbi:MAG TPA: carboxylesterase family protein [Bryobacteraceae bacterium]|nr:carboxylesterase family protein [Bryobacteraceae bacterium]
MQRVSFITTALCGFAAAALAATTGDVPIVHLDSGIISGTTGSKPEVRAYLGIPYAAPPVATLRWRAPQPVAHWDGVRPADKFSPVCMQNSNAQKTSEDCLYLNVWTTAKSAGERRPVMVWIYGGGFTGGSGSLPDYNGDALSQKGVVVVTFNYRLGPFGFLAHPELTKESDRRASGNYGLMDQVAALQWVQRNIAAFGGDPKKVTIFGESAGSVSVADLLTSPLTKGLFVRAIGESGAWMGLGISTARTLSEAEQDGVKLAEAVGAKSLAEMRLVPADAILKAGRGSGAIVDGWLLPEAPDKVYSEGKQHAVSVLVGSNQDEGTFFLRPTTAEQFTAQSRERYKSFADQFLKLYPAASDEQANASALMAFRDEAAWHMRRWAQDQTKAGKKSYLYYFTHEPPASPNAKGPRRRGATHVAEVPYVFQTPGQRPWTDVDRQLSDTMSSYWVNFASTGDPNGRNLPHWPAFDPKKNPDPMVLGDKIGPGPGPDPAHLDFFEQFYEKR